MAKTKIILADLDEKYLAPIEMKFLEELDDDIEMEVISRIEYFEEYFQQPRSADILVISDELYSSDLQKHGINHVFVLVEQMTQGSTEELLIKKIFKYSSTKEIYSQVSGVIRPEGTQKQKTTVIVVTSASGGTGKTTLAMGISSCLVKNYKRVLYLNVEGINSFQYMLNNRTPIPSNVYQEFKNTKPDLYSRIRHVIRNERFDYLPPFGAAISSLSIDYSMYKELIESVKLTKEYDAIIVDTDAIFNEAKSDLIMQADKVIMTVNQSKASVFAMNMLLKNMSCNVPDKFYFICNDYVEEADNALLSNETKPAFVVSDYINHIENIDRMTVNDLDKVADIQKLSVLIM